MEYWWTTYIFFWLIQQYWIMHTKFCSTILCFFWLESLFFFFLSSSKNFYFKKNGILQIIIFLCFFLLFFNQSSRRRLVSVLRTLFSQAPQVAVCEHCKNCEQLLSEKKEGSTWDKEWTLCSKFYVVYYVHTKKNILPSKKR